MSSELEDAIDTERKECGRKMQTERRLLFSNKRFFLFFCKRQKSKEDSTGRRKSTLVKNTIAHSKDSLNVYGFHAFVQSLHVLTVSSNIRINNCRQKRTIMKLTIPNYI